jgi:hypothetical protein
VEERATEPQRDDRSREEIYELLAEKYGLSEAEMQSPALSPPGTLWAHLHPQK